MSHLKQIRSIFFAYYLSFRGQQSPCLSFVAVPSVYREQTEFQENSKNFAFPDQSPLLVTFYEPYTPLIDSLNQDPIEDAIKIQVCLRIVRLMLVL